MTEGLRVRVGGDAVSLDIVFPVEAVEARILSLKRRVAGLAYRSRDSRVVRAASRLLVSLTELLEDLEEGEDTLLVLSRLRVLEAEVDSMLRSPEGYVSESEL